MVDLASLVVRLEAETARYQRELERARRDLQRFERGANDTVKNIAKSVGAAALAAAAALVAMGKSAIDAADNLNDLSKITGISVESLSQLRYAAEQSGTDLDGLVTSLRKFSKQASEAAAGNKGAAESFKKIGVSVTDASGKLKGTEQLLLEVADVFSKYRDGAAKAAAAQELFGKSGTTLIPFLNQGAAGIRELMKQADALGLTVSKKTAVAADDFNDKLNTLKAQLSTLGLQIAERFLPALLDIATALSDMLKGRTEIGGFLDFVATSFRAVAYAAVATVDTFQDVGRAIGAFFAAREQLIKGNFKGAARILAEYHADSIKAEKDTTERLAKIWGERADAYNSSLLKYKAAPGPSSRNRGNRIRSGIPELSDFPTEVAEAVDPVQEIEIKLKKIDTNEIDAYYAELERKTRTQTEIVLQAYSVDKFALKELLDAKLISQEQYTERLRNLQNKLLAEISKGPPKIEEQTKKINEYQLEAARNSQDIIAQTFEDLATGADVSAQSILKSFGQMLLRLAAQAAAANLAGVLFGAASGNTGAKGSGLVGAALGAFGFAASRDSGGRGRKGVPYRIGTGAQPEWFIPDTSGSFVPAGMGGASVTNNFIIQGDQPVAQRTQMQIAAAASRGVSRANRRNN